MIWPRLPLLMLLVAQTPGADATPTPATERIVFTDATEASGLPLMNSARLTFVDLNNDGRPDVVARERTADRSERYRVFINRAVPDQRLGFHFDERNAPGLPIPVGGDILTFADLDNDGIADAIFTRYLDSKNPKFVAPTTQPTATCWMKGNGDGTFAAPLPIDVATPATTACIAVGDANCDGLPDLVLGNWYDRYGESNSAYPTDLLLQRRDANGTMRFERLPLPEDGVPFDEHRDAGPRPTYGVLFARLTDSPLPTILQLNYGRRANRMYVPRGADPLRYEDLAAKLGVDGDDVRHGRYPEWLKEVGKTDKRFDRPDELPYRSHGNTFDAAVGDVDNDGRFDLFVSEITHAWAGDSSDRSRFLLQRKTNTGEPEFVYDRRLSVDREGTATVASERPVTQPATTTAEPSTGPVRRANWNQGDLFAMLADLDHDGRLDLILCSSDYPDPPPHENRLRIFQQQPDGRFVDVTSTSGVDHLGAQQPSLADVDGDGDLDLLIGQSFNRFTKEMIDQRTPPGPASRLFLNQVIDRRLASGQSPNSITLRLIGDPSQSVTRGAYNAVVRMTTVIDASTGQQLVQSRQLLGPGGHNGKGGDLIVHFGLGTARQAEEIRIDWPSPHASPTVLHNVRAGFHVVRCDAR